MQAEKSKKLMKDFEEVVTKDAVQEGNIQRVQALLIGIAVGASFGIMSGTFNRA